MWSENKAVCPYLTGGPFDGAACRIADTFIKDMSSVDVTVCMFKDYCICSVYRYYNEDLIEV